MDQRIALPIAVRRRRRTGGPQPPRLRDERAIVSVCSCDGPCAQRQRPGAARDPIASVGGFFGFYLELSVFPVLAARDHGSVAAGVLTFATMVATVCTQFVTPRLVHRVAPRTLLATGILLIGLPTLLLFASQSFAMLLVNTLIRGVGFGLLTVLGAAMIAASRPARSAARRSAPTAWRRHWARRSGRPSAWLRCCTGRPT